MKFAKQLEEYELPEWKGQYLPYDFLKKRLREIRDDHAGIAVIRLQLYLNPGATPSQCLSGRLGGGTRSWRSLFRRARTSSDTSSWGGGLLAERLPTASRQVSSSSRGNGSLNERAGEPPTQREALDSWEQVLEKEVLRIDALVSNALTELNSHLLQLNTEGDKTEESTLQRWGLEAISKVGDDVARLRSFAEINHAALFKVLKKHDKVLGVSTGIGEQYQHLLTLTRLADMDRFEHLENGVKEAFIRSPLCHGVEASLGVARVIGLGHLHGGNASRDSGSQLHVRKLFFFLGMSSALLVSILVLLMLPPTDTASFSTPYFFASFSVFRVCFSVTLCMWCVGIVSDMCKHNFINHMYLLDIDPRCSIGPNFMYLVAAILSSLWILVFGMYVVDFKWMVLPVVWASAGFSPRSSFHYSLYPMVLFVLTIIIMLTPSGICRCRYKLALCRSVGRTCAAPFFKVTFGDNLVGDVMTSLAKPLQDVPAAFCYILSHHPQRSTSLNRFIMHGDNCPQWEHRLVFPLIGGLPFFFRLMQCARRFCDTRETKHLFNFAKYIASLLVFAVTFFKMDTVVIVGVSIFATVYAAIWDIRMDWGLGWKELNILDTEMEFEARNTNLLDRDTGAKRGKRHFGPHTYWFAVIFDCLARSAWVLTLMPIDVISDSTKKRVVLQTMTSVIEITRRAMWVILRIEYEQVANASGFRRILWVPRPYDLSSVRDYRAYAAASVPPSPHLERKDPPGADALEKDHHQSRARSMIEHQSKAKSLIELMDRSQAELKDQSSSDSESGNEGG